MEILNKFQKLTNIQVKPEGNLKSIIFWAGKD